jgi:predicted AlkP superfamily pyrophosphatase or phosphodiesterase
MINEKSLHALKNARFSTQFNRPIYDTYSFARIPDTIEKLLSTTSKQPLPADTFGDLSKPYDMVILILIDGFGWEFFERYASKYPFLQRFAREGIASKISSEFPSTTAAHITSINTGLEVGQTGIYEWFYYEPLFDRMISPLLFSYAGDHVPGTLAETGITSQEVYPFKTIYQHLHRKGVRSVVMQHETISHSPYSQALLKGADQVPFTQFPQALEHVASLCHAPQQKPTYIFLYFGDIDGKGHRHGIHSKEFSDAVDFCFKTLEERLWQQLKGSQKKIATVVTADHGMVSVDPKRTIYLNELIPKISNYFKKNRAGKPLVPAGSCRDFFLHVEEEHLNHVLSLLRKNLEGIAEVHPTSELIKAGFFGQRTHYPRLNKRIGNLVILPFANEGVWWFEKHRFEQHFYGAHGGLTPNEMESIFLFLSN